MLVIFIVDSNGVCEMANATWHHMVGLEARVRELETQAAVTELALRTLIGEPDTVPATAVREARDILRTLEG